MSTRFCELWGLDLHGYCYTMIHTQNTVKWLFLHSQNALHASTETENQPMCRNMSVGSAVMAEGLWELFPTLSGMTLV